VNAPIHAKGDEWASTLQAQPNGSLCATLDLFLLE